MNEYYGITVHQDVTYSLNSMDNKSYDIEIQALSVKYNSGNYVCHEVMIENFTDGSETGIVIVGDYCANVGSDGIILRDDYFLILLNAVIIVLCLDDMKYHIIRIENPYGAYYSIYSYKGAYIIYGELEVRKLDANFCTIWTYCTLDILINPEKSLEIKNNHIIFYDWDGNYHDLDMDGKLYYYKKREPIIIKIDVSKIDTPREFQEKLKLKLGMPDFYGMNWSAFWDGITGLIQVPDMIVLVGWHIYKKKQPKDARRFKEIMGRYNELYSYCECAYR